MKHIDINKIRRAMALVAVVIVTMASAMAQTAVNYIDKDGIEQTCETYIEVGTTTTAWNAGWYLVNGEVVIGGGVTVTGEVHLILADGASLTVTGAAGKAGVNVSGTDNSLTIYGQAGGTGQLTANGTGYANGTGGGAGIGGNDMQAGGNITVNGGIVTANGGGGGAGIGGGADGTAYNIEINRGTVTANGSLLSTGIGMGATTGTERPQFKFSVSKNHGTTVTQVSFSYGNLYYDGSKWHFENNQYDYRTYGGFGAKINGMSATTPASHWGLFGWSTNANNYGMVDPTNGNCSGSFVDWGNNTIDETTGWRTLTAEEWDYLLHTTNGSRNQACRPNADNLWGKGTVCGIQGLIILPDEWQLPVGLTFSKGSKGQLYSANTYNAENWAKMENAGAIFLPAAGRRQSTSEIYQVGDRGSYWSASPHWKDSEWGYYYQVRPLTVDFPDATSYRRYGLSVRLVREPKAPNTTVTLTLSIGGNTVAEALGVAWKESDVVNVYSGDEQVGTLNCRNHDGNTATFTGYINENLTAGTQLTFRRGTTPAFTEQDGALVTLQANYSLEGTAEYTASGNYTMNIGVPYAVMKLDLSAFGTAEGTTVTISAGGSTVASVNSVKTSSKELYVAMPVAASREYTFSGNSLTGRKTWTLEANKFYTKDGSSTGGAIVVGPPVFSVSADKTVEFAPGNLYWDGTAEGGKKWKFEANQWDYRTWAGKNSCINGNVSKTGTPAQNCGLFKWSKDTNAVTSDSNYSGELFCKNGFTVNGQTGWSTLSNDEWKYLLGKGNSYRANAANLRKWVTLTLSDEVTVNGLVVLPDGDALSPAIPGTIDEAFLSSNNAVFLPAAGYRDGTDVGNVGSHGYYCSSTLIEDDEDYAYRMFFYSGDAYTNGSFRRTGLAVRLVR